MHDCNWIKCGSIALLSGLCVVVGQAQERDSLRQRTLTDVEVVERARPSLTQQTAPVQRLDREGVDRLGLQELSEAVKRFSGVAVKDYGGIGGLKTVSIRSLGTQHTAVSYDGVTISDVQSGQVDLSRFSLDNVESLSLSIGQNDDIFQTARYYASSGVLDIRTERPRLTDRSFRLTGQVKSGSFGLFNPVVRYEQRLSSRYALSLHTDYMRADGQYPFTLTNGGVTTEEKRSNSDINTFRSELNLFADWQRQGKLRLKGYWFDSNRGLPGSVVLYNNYHTERLQNKNGFLQALYERSLSQRLSLKAQTKFDYARTRYRDIHPHYQEGHQTDVYTQREYYASLAALYQPVDGLSFSFAEDLFFNSLDATTPKCVFPERFSSLTALAAHYKNRRLSATVSLLATYITEEVERIDPAPDRKRLSPAVALSYLLLRDQNIRVRASVKDAYRMPTFNDLYFDRIGSRSIRPERATQYNMGLTWSYSLPDLAIEYISLTADGYYNRVKDKIVAIPTLFIWRMTNMGDVDITGLDLNLTAHITLPASMRLLLDGSFTLQQAIDVTDKTNATYRHQLPYTPKQSGSLSLTWENRWLNLSWLMTAVSERYALPQNVEMNRMDGYMEQQIAMNRSFRFHGSTLRLQAELINLTDVSYEVIRHYPMPGRSFRVSIKYIY